MPEHLPLTIILKTAIQGCKVMQDFKLESLTTGGEHFQKVKAPPFVSDYDSKDCVNLPPSTAVSRIMFCRFLFLALFHLLIIDSGAACLDQHKTSLGLAAIFREDARFLKEWIEYYKLMGVEKFYLYNNLSTDHYLQVLEPYITEGSVQLTDWNRESCNVIEWNAIQSAAYAHGMSLARAEGIQWLIVVDTDEFIVPVRHNSLEELVRDYEKSDVGMLCGLWIMYGTSGVAEIPDRTLMIETLRLNGGPQSAIAEKSILHTGRAETGGPHYGTCLKDWRTVHLPLEVLQINHYWSRDEKYFYEYKIPRRMLWGWSPEKSEEFMRRFNHAEFLDWSLPIQRFAIPLKKRMGFPAI